MVLLRRFGCGTESAFDESGTLCLCRVVVLGMVLDSDSFDESESLACCRVCFRMDVVVLKKFLKAESVEESSSSLGRLVVRWVVGVVELMLSKLDKLMFKKPQ